MGHLVAPDKRAGLILVARQVQRGGREHTQHFWVKPEEAQPGDKTVTDPAFIKMLDARAERARQTLLNRWRDKKKDDGLSTPPEKPPPKPSDPAPLKNPPPPVVKKLSPEEQRVEDALEQSRVIQNRRASVRLNKLVLENEENRLRAMRARGESVSYGDELEVRRMKQQIVELEAKIEADKSTSRAELQKSLAGKSKFDLPELATTTAGSLTTGEAATIEGARMVVKERLAALARTLADGRSLYSQQYRADRALALQAGIQAMKPALSNVSSKINDAVSVARAIHTLAGTTPAREASARTVRDFKAEDNLISGSGAAIATHSRYEDRIRINYDQSEKLLKAFVSKDATTHGGHEAINTLTHELLHGASHGSYDYEREKASQRPHAAMEEATTEILAHHYSDAVARELGMTHGSGKDRPLFEVSSTRGQPYATRAVAYNNFVVRFGLMASFTEGHLDHDVVESVKSGSMGMSGMEAHHWKVDKTIKQYAAAVKPMRGSMRYRYMADRYLERNGVPRHTKEFNDARNAVAGHFEKFLGQNKGRGKAYEKVFKSCEREMKRAAKAAKAPAYEHTEIP